MMACVSASLACPLANPIAVTIAVMSDDWERKRLHHRDVRRLSHFQSIRCRTLLYTKKGPDMPSRASFFWAIAIVKEHMKAKRRDYVPQYPREPK